jgi:hypothetical protein
VEVVQAVTATSAIAMRTIDRREGTGIACIALHATTARRRSEGVLGPYLRADRPLVDQG